jgi:hypothetical protein
MWHGNCSAVFGVEGDPVRRKPSCCTAWQRHVRPVRSVSTVCCPSLIPSFIFRFRCCCFISLFLGLSHYESAVFTPQSPLSSQASADLPPPVGRCNILLGHLCCCVRSTCPCLCKDLFSRPLMMQQVTPVWPSVLSFLTLFSRVSCSHLLI